MDTEPRVLTADTEGELWENAQNVFGVSRELLRIGSIKKMQNDKLCAMVCLHSQWSEISNMDGQYKLHYLSDGVFLELLPAQGKGMVADIVDSSRYIERKGIQNINMEVVKNIFTLGQGYAKIATPQSEVVLNEDVTITISPDEMAASLTLLPPDANGELLTMEKLKARIAVAGINYGVNEEQLSSVLQRRPYYQMIIFARGTAPVNGLNGKLIFHFDLNHSGTPLLIEETGRVDYKQLDLFESVTEGALLVTRVLATTGDTGYSIKGRQLPPIRGKEAKMPHGTKVRFNDERTEMYAACSGRVDFKNGAVCVSNIYEVSGDVDLSVGNINFDGDVVVRGNVISGLEIRASGNVSIYGVVQRSKIFAGGDVLIANGLQGMDGGFVETQGRLTAKYIERGMVKAAQGVLVDQITHSRVESKGDVVVSGKRGMVVGGSIKAVNMVVATTLGSISNTKTCIEVGLDPSVAKRISALAEENAALEKQIEEFEKISKYLTPLAQDSEELQEKLRAVVMSRLQKVRKLQQNKKEYGELLQQAENSKSGVVHVTDICYPGVTVTIGTRCYQVQNSCVRAATFKLIDNELQFVPNEYSGRNPLLRGTVK